MPRPTALAPKDLETIREAASMGLLSDSFKHKHVVFTGTLSLRREDLASIVKMTGGRIDADVSSVTNYLVHGDTGPHGVTAKMQEAARRGVHVITEAEFVNMLSVV